MRTTISVDNDLLMEAMRITKLRSKKIVAEEALRRLISHHRRKAALANLAGLGWEGDVASRQRDADAAI